MPDWWANRSLSRGRKAPFFGPDGPRLVPKRRDTLCLRALHRYVWDKFTTATFLGLSATRFRCTGLRLFSLYYPALTIPWDLMCKLEWISQRCRSMLPRDSSCLWLSPESLAGRVSDAFYARKEHAMTPSTGNFIVEGLFLLTFIVGLFLPHHRH